MNTLFEINLSVYTVSVIAIQYNLQIGINKVILTFETSKFFNIQNPSKEHIGFFEVFALLIFIHPILSPAPVPC